MNHNKLTLIIFFIVYPIYLDISIGEDVNLIAAIVTLFKGIKLAFLLNIVYCQRPKIMGVSCNKETTGPLFLYFSLLWL